ncbi:sodium-coupled monocarboxylate transporter 1-like [Oppia nitens]|uniref:sodium-coupled monocarboxylate transporter 1-like n=1 Tax=Oppia nitens TaxID=1686743 RepID=UPI0023DA8E1F|nr:sodium-coupled monocarboxylate transporter 1-like [Oppia nitens]
MVFNMKTVDQIENNFSLADYSVFAAMLCISTAIGVYYAFKKKNASNKEFLTANKSLSMFPVAMSLLASFQSSVTILGYPAEMFYRGTQFWAVVLSGAMASIIAAEIFLPIYYNLQFTSVNKYLEERFGNEKVRLAVSMSFLLCTIPYMGVVLYGPALALASVTPLNVSTSVLIIGGICTLYTSIGGIRAVVWTDLVQVFLMFGGLIVVMIRAFYLVGGVEQAFRIANQKGRIQFFNFQIDPYSTSTFWNAVFGMGIMWSGNYATSQTEVQRYCNVESQAKAKLSLYVNLIGMVLLISCACLCGISIFAYYSDCDPLTLGLIKKTDQLMPYFVMDQLTIMPGMPGLFVACVFSASLSTLSSGFNALSAVTYDDFLCRYPWIQRQSEVNSRRISRALAFSYGLIAICMAFVVSSIDSVLQAAISIAGALVGPMFGLFLLGVLFPFANTFGVLCGLFTGELFGIWVLVGSLLYPKGQHFMETSVTNCPKDMLQNITLITREPLVQSEGLLSLYHIAYLLVPVSGFVISVSVGAIASLLSGGYSEASKINPKLLSPLVWKIWSTKYLPEKQQIVIIERQSLTYESEIKLTKNNDSNGKRDSICSTTRL